MAFAGKYEYEDRPLYRDAQGALYAGKDGETGNPVFLKLAGDIPAEVFVWPESAEEMGLLPAREMVREKKAVFFVAQHTRGKLLSELLPDMRTAGIYGRHRLLGIFLCVCDAVRNLHGLGLAHGSIHPGSILVSDAAEPRARLVCFHPMEARMAAGDPAENDFLIYLAQEQLRGAGGASVDIYALGVLLFTMFAAAPPYAGSSGYELAERAMWGNFKAFRPSLEGLDPPRAQSVEPEINTVGSVAHRAIQRSPAARYGSAAEMIDSLARVERRLSPTVLGMRLYSEGRTEQAAAALEEAVGVEDPALANIWLGQIYGLVMGEYEKGVAAFKRALKANPELETARVNLARLYSKFGRHALAKNAYTELLNQRPQDVQLLTGYAKVLNDSGNYEGAMNVLDSVQRIDPFNLAAYTQAIRIAMAHDDGKRAESFCSRAIQQILKVVHKGNLQRQQVAEVYYLRAALHRLAGREEQAVKWLNHALEQDSGNVASHLMLTEIRWKRGETEEAIRHFLAMLSLSPDRQDVMESLKKIIGSDGA